MTESAALADLKREIERVARIYRWSPSEHQLLTLAHDIVVGGVRDRAALTAAISRAVPGTKLELVEGVDNSDVDTLLELARKVSEAR